MLSTQTVTSDTLQVVIFSLENATTKKNEEYGIPIEQIKEIRTLDAITRVPNTVSHIKGIVNLRGMIIPVVDVKMMLGFSNETVNTDQTRILVAEVKDSLVGLLVDDVDRVMRLPKENVEPAPRGTIDTNQFVQGIAKTDDSLLVLIDVEKLMSSESSNFKDLKSKTMP